MLKYGEQDLVNRILSFKYDPLSFVYFAFPWGRSGTPLAHWKRPRQWQIDELALIRDHFIQSKRDEDKVPPVYYCSISSGRGTGKTAFLAMLNYWLMSCWWGGTGICTANTELQLKTRTMAELGKWHAMAINSHWFVKSTLSLQPASWFSKLLLEQRQISSDLYGVTGQPWSEENPDAFAGAHSTHAMLLSIDEASGVADTIWRIGEGFFTDLAGMRLWVNISNGRRKEGRFFECFHRDKAFWHTRIIDSRTVEGLDYAVYDRIIEEYGEDSDVARVEVYGLFPLSDVDQFIPQSLIADAMARTVPEDLGAPLLMGVDVARFGENESVIRYRQGNNGRFKSLRFRNLTTTQLANKIATEIDRKAPDGVFVDAVGVGAGVVDYLRLLGYSVVAVNAGTMPDNREKYYNKRAEMWDKMRKWLETAMLPAEHSADVTMLTSALTAPTYDFDDNKSRLRLESKRKMRARGVTHLDDGDALSHTFYMEVARPEWGDEDNPNLKSAITEYDEFNHV